jgi:hypothetical protein
LEISGRARRLTNPYGGGDVAARLAEQSPGRVIDRHPKQPWRTPMSQKILSTAILAGLLLGLAAPVVQAKSAPKTKAECEKISNMKWDDSTSKCVKK